MAEVTDEQQTNGQPLEAVVSAAKIAAVSAAVGAAAAAAKAFASRHDHDEEEPEGEQPDEEPQDAVQELDDEDQEPEEQRDEMQLEPEGEPEEQEQEEEEPEPVEGASLGDAQTAARRARTQLEELLGKPVESVSSLERTHDGWVAALEVVELSRIPESTDVLASYEVELDEGLDFRRYQQARRYTRSQADSGDQ